jgi:16S rRNA (cytosine1402-N4)-methyltransferase
MEYHQPVLLLETLASLDIKNSDLCLDATLGNAGHSLEILKLGAKVYGLDQDPHNLKIATDRIKEAKLDKNFIPLHGNFNQLKEIVNQHIKKPVDALLVDLGLSQNQQKSTNRGFSFNDDKSLDMRLDPESQSLTAEEVINTYSFDQLYQIFTKNGQELYSKPIILRIITERQKTPITNAKRLADIIRDYYKNHHFKSRIDPSTKIFLALKIAVNQEFQNLQSLLLQSLQIIKSGGSVAIITFHSGEDRIVKQFIRHKSKEKIITSTNKPIAPSRTEIKNNPLSRSALLRSYKIV